MDARIVVGDTKWMLGAWLVGVADVEPFDVDVGYFYEWMQWAV